MRAVMIDGVLRFGEIGTGGRVLAGIQIAVETGEIAARNLDANLVPFQEYVAGIPQVDLELVDLSGRDGVSFTCTVAIARAQNAFRKVLRKSVRPHVHKLACEVRIRRG